MSVWQDAAKTSPRISGRIQSIAAEAHMKPPYCHLCHKDCRCESWHFKTGGGYVCFSDFRPFMKMQSGILDPRNGFALSTCLQHELWHLSR